MRYDNPNPEIWDFNIKDGVFYRSNESSLKLIKELEEKIILKRSKKMRPRNVRQVRRMELEIMKWEGHILKQV